MAAFKLPYINGSDSSLTQMQNECSTCKQEIPPKCSRCGQFIHTKSDNIEECPDCGQELESQSEEEDEVPGGYQIKRCKNGVGRAICKLCRRKLEACPSCKELYSESDAPTSEEDETDEEGEEESEEDSADDDQRGGSQRKLKGKRWDL